MPSRHAAVLTVLLSTLALFGACNGQGEGDSCDPRNGNNDCRNGYYCKPLSPQSQGSRCCPGDQALATTVVCGLDQGVSTDASSAAPPPDASLSDGDATTSVDASEDAPSSDGSGDGD